MELSGSTAAAQGLWARLSHSLELFPAADCIKKFMHIRREGGDLRVALVRFKAPTLCANSHLHFKSW